MEISAVVCASVVSSDGAEIIVNRSQIIAASHVFYVSTGTR